MDFRCDSNNEQTRLVYIAAKNILKGRYDKKPAESYKWNSNGSEFHVILPCLCLKGIPWSCGHPVRLLGIISLKRREQTCLQMNEIITSLKLSHDLLMPVSLLVLDFRMTFSWISHAFLMTFTGIFSWISYDFLMTCSWLSHEFLMTFSWLSNGFIINFSGFLGDFCMSF